MSNFIHKIAIRTALNAQTCAPFWLLVQTGNILRTTKAKKAPNVMLTAKNTQKPLPATLAHLNELLDEALKETFPASDPIAINVELESPEHGIATTPGIPLSGTRKTRWRR
jgi:hypothetical protein